MPIDPASLTALAARYAQGMTSIRGRRVQRLLKREFAGAEHVAIVPLGVGRHAVVGVSASGAAFCATDGRGQAASVARWLHGSTQAVVTNFDLLKDSLPALETRAVPIPAMNLRIHPDASAGSIETLARDLAGVADSLAGA